MDLETTEMRATPTHRPKSAAPTLARNAILVFVTLLTSCDAERDAVLADCTRDGEELVLRRVAGFPYPLSDIPTSMTAFGPDSVFVLGPDRASIHLITEGGLTSTHALPAVVSELRAGRDRILAPSGRVIVTVDRKSLAIGLDTLPDGVAGVSSIREMYPYIWVQHDGFKRLSRLRSASRGTYVASWSTGTTGEVLLAREGTTGVVAAQTHHPFTSVAFRVAGDFVSEAAVASISGLSVEESANSVLTTALVRLECGVAIQALADLRSEQRWLALVDVRRGTVVRVSESTANLGLVDRLDGHRLILGFVTSAGRHEVAFYSWSWD